MSSLAARCMFGCKKVGCGGGVETRGIHSSKK